MVLELIDPENGSCQIDQSERWNCRECCSVFLTLDNITGCGWVPTRGLNIIDQNAETVHPLATTNIVSMMEDAVGNLWVATQKGVINNQFSKKYHPAVK